MAAPVIAAQGSFVTYTTSASAAVPVPSGVASGSKVIVHISCAWNETGTPPTSAAITTPSGFSLAYGAAFTDTTDGYVMYEAWYEKTATGADTGTYTFTGGTLGGQPALAIGGVAFRITGASDPALGGAIQTSPSAVTDVSAIIPAFTPSRDNSLLLFFGASFGLAGTGPTVSAGWTNLGTASGSGATSIMAASVSQTTATSTGTLTFDLKSSDFMWGTVATVLSPGVDITITPPAATLTLIAPNPVPSTGNGAVVASPVATATFTAPAPSASTGGGIPTLSGETSRTTGTTSGGTPYTKVVGSLANATSGGSDGYVAYIPTAGTHKLLMWNHPYESPYDADIAGTGDSGWTWNLTSWLLDNGIAIAASSDAGDQFGLPPVMTAESNLYGAINTALGVSKLIVYGESMGGSACLNWTARNNAAPLVGAMLISGVCDTSKFTSYFTYNAAYNPMITPASDWAGLPIFLASSPGDTTVIESENAQAFATHVSGQAIVTEVETTGGHLTSGNYPVSSMETWISGLMASGSGVTIPAPVATIMVSAPAPIVTVPRDTVVMPPVASFALAAAGPTLSGTNVAVTAPVALFSFDALAPVVVIGYASYWFSPPTHEEGMRVKDEWLRHFRLTHANSVYWNGASWVSQRVVNDDVIESLEEGVTYFRGGCYYEITPDVAHNLEAGGYNPQPLS